MTGKVETPFLIGVREDFCVGPFARCKSRRRQFPAQLTMIINLAVEDGRDIAVRGCRWVRRVLGNSASRRATGTLRPQGEDSPRPGRDSGICSSMACPSDSSSGEWGRTQPMIPHMGGSTFSRGLDFAHADAELEQRRLSSWPFYLERNFLQGFISWRERCEWAC